MTPSSRPHPAWLFVIACAVVLLATARSAAEPGARYEVFPEPEVRWRGDHRTSSAYVLDKQDNRFWICTVRYNFSSEKDNNGDCVSLPTAIGRPSLTPAYQSRPILGSPLISAELPVFWFVEPASGDVQFCAPRHPGVCVTMQPAKVPQSQ